MKLYYATGVCSLAPHIALSESGLDYTVEQVHLSTHKTASGADLSAVNPKGYVPVLELEDGQRLTENAAILQYIADLAPQSGLLPASGMERYRTLEWVAFITTELHKGFSVFFKQWGDKPWEMAREKLAMYFGQLNEHLKDKSYLMGENFTVADGYLYTVLTWANPAGIDLKPWPALQAFMKRVAARPAVQRALETEGLQAYAA